MVFEKLEKAGPIEKLETKVAGPAETRRAKAQAVKRFGFMPYPEQRLSFVMKFEQHVFKRFIGYFVSPDNRVYVWHRIEEMVPGEKMKITGGSVVVRLK